MKPFTYEEYRYILNQVRGKYIMTDYTGALLTTLNTDSNIAVLRHDVDVELSKAIKLAEIENELGLVSTFFIMVTSDAYNICSKESRKIINKLISFGHNLGLHFDPTVYSNSSNHNLELCAYKEKRILENQFSIEVNALSYHCYYKLPERLKFETGMINVSEEPFMTQLKYFADSYGCWKFGHPLKSEHFSSGKPLHLSFHPEWWNDVEISPIISVLSLVDYKKKKFKNYLMENILGLG
jgi:hypothetical protein